MARVPLATGPGHAPPSRALGGGAPRPVPGTTPRAEEELTRVEEELTRVEAGPGGLVENDDAAD
ncbi:hypothetical protein SAMN05443637_1093 [Pseudonocardia thermophila]|jgi:hypothetical protein|uniref:Uncharacterized protein n=1 Tax=Pseudonocardia thermophila TaxID=1848 RepID=A0A1M6TXK3_PSETH|nr:hypothetical protein SAMN05443637_1093 [Pseudonocardia thermophila]